MNLRETKYLPHLHKQEKISLVLRRHWLMPVGKALFWTFLIAVFLVGSGWLKANFSVFSSGRGLLILDILVSVFLLTALLGLLIVWTMYYLNVQIVTNRRIIDINQKNLVHHETTEFELTNVQDVTTEVRGVLANLFDYGSVYVQTAGTAQNFVFEHVAAPHRVAKTVLALAGELTARHKNRFPSGAGKPMTSATVRK